MMEMFYVLTVLVISQGYASVKTYQLYTCCQTVYIYNMAKGVKERRELEAKSPHVLSKVQRRPLYWVGGWVRGCRVD